MTNDRPNPRHQRPCTRGPTRDVKGLFSQFALMSAVDVDSSPTQVTIYPDADRSTRTEWITARTADVVSLADVQ